MFKKLFLFFAIVLLASCQTKLTNDFSFLEGNWKMQLEDSNYILESWQQIDDHHYTALNYVVSDTGMQLSEEIEIDITDSGTYYKPTIEGLNGGFAFSYKFVSQDENKYVFENKEYDFPCRIWYKIIDDKNMQAGIENATGDKRQTFVFEKVEK